MFLEYGLQTVQQGVKYTRGYVCSTTSTPLAIRCGHARRTWKCFSIVENVFVYGGKEDAICKKSLIACGTWWKVQRELCLIYDLGTTNKKMQTLQFNRETIVKSVYRVFGWTEDDVFGIWIIDCATRCKIYKGLCLFYNLGSTSNKMQTLQANREIIVKSIYLHCGIEELRSFETDCLYLSSKLIPRGLFADYPCEFCGECHFS